MSLLVVAGALALLLGMKLGYVILYVKDVLRSVAFYEEAFGLKRSFVHEAGLYAEMDTGATTLSFAAYGLAKSNLPCDFREHNLAGRLRDSRSPSRRMTCKPLMTVRLPREPSPRLRQPPNHGGRWWRLSATGTGSSSSSARLRPIPEKAGAR